MGLKAVLIKKYGEEEVIEPKGTTFTMQELCELIGTKQVEFMASKIPNCVIVADKNAKANENWFLNVNQKASELARSSIGQATIVGDIVICNKKFLNEGLPKREKTQKHTRFKQGKQVLPNDNEPQVDFNPPPPPM